MKYKLLTAESAEQLSDLVTEYLSRGWELYSSSNISSISGVGWNKWCFAQSVILK